MFRSIFSPAISMISRRNFLKSFGAAAVFAVAGRVYPGVSAERFDILVIGDSLVWGQGLLEEQKFYSLTRDWIRDEIVPDRNVGLLVKAHSGATIKLSEEEAKVLRAAGKDMGRHYHPEINISFPTIEDQVRSSVQSYPDPNTVRLILVTAGLPEVGVRKILNPGWDVDRLKADITRYCYGDMTELLNKTAGAFPKALTAVVGYYPIITPRSPVKRVANDIMELHNWPGWIKPLVNNPLNRTFLRHYWREMVKRSTIWYEWSSAEFKRAVETSNAAAGHQHSVFVPLGFTEDNGYGAKSTYLYTVGKNGKAADPIREQRLAVCKPTFDYLRKDTDLKYRTRTCELASVGHPNPEGSRAIAAAIRDTLGPILEKRLARI